MHQTILIDLLAKSGAGSILFEMKSCLTLSIRGQVRRGISQLLEYSFLDRDEITAPQLCLVLERKPTRTSTWLIDYVESLGISMLWKLDRDDQLGCSKTSQQRLLTLISCMQDWVCE